MSDLDWGWVVICAFAAANTATHPGILAQAIWGSLLLIVFLVRMARPPKQQQGTAQQATPKPADGIRDMLDAFREAGFTEDQARELVQEAMRTEVRKQGGWRP